jgi:hypothetical protein
LEEEEKEIMRMPASTKSSQHQKYRHTTVTTTVYDLGQRPYPVALLVVTF